MKESFEIYTILPVDKEGLFNAWLDSEQHSLFTGEDSKIEPKVGGKFTAGGEYIKGTTTELEPHSKIVQKWRTTEFDETDEDSTLELLLSEEGEGTRFILKHSNIPEGQGENYKQGWVDYYFEPMKEYFQDLRE